MNEETYDERERNEEEAHDEKLKIEEETEETIIPEEPVKPAVDDSKILKDPTTGKPLRTQTPGVPNSPWVGKHGSSDMENQGIMERKKKESEKRLNTDLEENE